MPNLPMHIYLASRVAESLDWDWVNDHVGSLWLGSTAPDIRAMTKWPRERTHFAPLSAEEVGAGPRALFQLHPELAGRHGLSPATRAFLVGYVCHLMADEAWIASIYRPYFGAPQAGGKGATTEVEAHIWDRALQLDMDRKALPQVGALLRDGEALSGAGVGVEVGFLDSGEMEEWCEWVRRFVGWEFTWERLRRSLKRMYRDNDEVQQAVDGFIDDIPHSLERVYEKISPETIEAFQQAAHDATLALVREHWDQTQADDP